MESSGRPIFCDTCGGTLKYSQDGKSAVCPYCGNEYSFTGGRTEALSLALARANAYRLNCDFDEAAGEYKLIIANNPEDAEAYWGLVLCRYGVEYIDDLSAGRRVPTCRRLSEGSILQDGDYLNALKYADESQAASYRAKAEEIDALQLAIRACGERYDVFLCYLPADKNGTPTRESAVAERIRGELVRRGISVFSPEISLAGKGLQECEAVIFRALYGCRYFILIACGEGNLNSPRVKNQWSRFCDRAFEERLYGACCAVYENMPASALPSFLRAQGTDLANYPAGGYEIEIADNISAKLSAGFRPNAAEGGRAGGAFSYGELNEILAEGRDALARGDFVHAAAEYSRAIDKDGDCGEAWLGAFLADVEVREIKSESKLARELSNRLWASGSTAAECRQRLAYNEHMLYSLSSPYYKNAVRYCAAGTAAVLTGAKRSVMDMAEKCNASLKLCLDECIKRESANGAEYTYDDYYNDNYADGGYSGFGSAAQTSANLAGAAAVGGALGYIFGRTRRYVRPFRRHVSPPVRPAPPPRHRPRPMGGAGGPRPMGGFGPGHGGPRPGGRGGFGPRPGGRGPGGPRGRR